MPERTTSEGPLRVLASRLLHQVKGFIFDRDGRLLLGDRHNRGLKPLPGAVELTSLLRHQGVPFVVCTNGTTRVPSDYAGILRDLGFPVENGSVLTPASAAVDLFHQLGYRRGMGVGGDGASGPLRGAGIEGVPRGRASG